MKRAMMGTVALIAVLCASAWGEEGEIPPQGLAQFGLSGLKTVSDSQAQPHRASSAHRPVHAGPSSPHVIYGQRQLYILTHSYELDSLGRQAWRWAHRASKL